jgi:hypothetical protein
MIACFVLHVASNLNSDVLQTASGGHGSGFGRPQGTCTATPAPTKVVGHPKWRGRRADFMDSEVDILFVYVYSVYITNSFQRLSFSAATEPQLGT